MVKGPNDSGGEGVFRVISKAVAMEHVSDCIHYNSYSPYIPHDFCACFPGILTSRAPPLLLDCFWKKSIHVMHRHKFARRGDLARDFMQPSLGG